MRNTILFVRARGHKLGALLQKLIANLWMASVLWWPVSAIAQSPAEIGELFASETTTQGPVLLAGTGMSVASGSQVAAGKSVATLRLVRGGEVRICPNAGLTVSTVQNATQPSSQELMLSIDTGSLELDYPLNDLADTLMTPDFKLMLAGPGVFHFALGVNNQGDTCIKPMHGNSASLIVSEMLGNGVYQVKPDEAVVFAGGKLDGRSPLETTCGCPTPAPVIQAEQTEPLVPTERPKQEEQQKQNESSLPRVSSDVTAPLPPEKPDAIHVQVEAPLVFRGDQPEPVYAVAHIKFSTLPNVFLAQEDQKPVVLKPGKGGPSTKDKEKKGFFGRIRGFFSALFHK